MTKPTTLDELFEDYAKVREADLARDDAYDASPAGQAARQARIADEIRRGIRDADGDWIVPDEAEADEDDEDDEDLDDED